MEVRVDVKHYDEPKMAGKVFPVGSGHIFLHEHSETQEHYKLGADVAFDVCLIDWLCAWNAEAHLGILIHVRNRKTKKLQEITPERVRQIGAPVTQGGRHRYFVPDGFFHAPFRTDYRIPYPQTVVVLDPGNVAFKPWTPITPPEEAKAAAEAQDAEKAAAAASDKPSLL
jgi:hypothetical protein